MKKTRFYSVSLLFVVVVFGWGAGVRAQEATETPAAATPQIADTCGDVRFLMARDTTPDQLLQGGGVLQAGATTSGQVGAGTDMGDYWLFSVDGATNNTTMTVSFSDLPADVPFEFALFQGMTRITTGNTYQVITAGETYTLPTKANGVYTLVVQLAHINDLERLSQTVTYKLTANFQTGGDVTAAVNAQQVRDGQTSQPLVEGQDYAVQDGKQVFTFRNSSIFKVNATGLKSVTQMPDKAGRVDFDGGGTLIVDSWAKEISLLGGNLSVIGQVNKVQRIYYIENFGAGESLINPTQSNLRDISDSNGTHVATDWQGITGIWVMTDCMGYKLADGRIFTAVVDTQITQRDFQIFGAPDAAQVNCNAFQMRVSAINTVGKTVDENLCMSWKPVDAGTEVTLRGGVLEASLINGRSIRLQSDVIRMVPLDGAKNADSPDLPVDIQVNDDGQPVSIKLDWINLAAFGYADDGANGRTLSFTFIDEPRTSTTRPGANVQSVDALDDVLHIVYRGANGRELLLLPRSESYLEMVTPAGSPTFDGAAFNAQALPNEAGYQARGLNNLGGECYPVNTLLDQFNCAPNGDINPANGNLWYSVTDLTAYHPVFNLSLTRSYNSYDFAQDGAFGPGWSSDFPLDYTVGFDTTTNSRLVDLANADPATRINYRLGLDATWAARGIVLLTTASGSQHEFVRDDKTSGSQGEIYRALTMPGWSVSRTGTDAVARVRSNWTLTENSGLIYTFDRAGRMRSLGYPAQGYTATINYPWEDNLAGPGGLGDKPVTITDSTGTRQIELFYDQSHHIVTSRLRDLTKAGTDTSGCDLKVACFEVKYGYSNGRLTEVTYPGGQKATYAYDDQGRLIRHDDPRAPIAPIMGYIYDDTGSIGQAAVTAAYILNADENAPKDDSFAWRRLDTTIDSGKQRQVTVTDENGTAKRYVYQLAASGLTTTGDSYTLLESDNLWATAGSFEAVPTKYEWAAGQLASIPNRFLQGATTSGRNRVDLNTDANGQIAGLSGGYPGVNITSAAGTPGQFPIRQIVPQQLNFADGSAWNFGGYNEAGFFTNYSDAQAAKYSIERDTNNRPTRIVRNDDKVTWVLTYDSGTGLLSSVQQTNLPKNDTGYTVKYEWDGLGRLATVTDDVLGTYKIAYAPAQQDVDGSYYTEITVTDPSGAVTVSRFDGRNRLIETRLQSSADAKDYLSRTTYEYDPADKLGRVSASVRWLAGTGDPTAARTTYIYEARAQLDQVGEAMAIGGTKVTQTDAYGRQTIAIYDALGRIRLMGDPQGALRRFDYTVDGVRNPLPVNQINPNGLKIVETDYLTGQLTATTNYLFDYGWQLTGVIRTEQNPFASTSGSWTAEWRLFSQTVNALNPNVKSLIAPDEAFPDPGIVWGGYVNGRPTQVTAQRTNPLTGKPDIDPNLKTSFDFLGRPLELTQTVNGAAQTTLISYCVQASGGTLELRSKPGASAVGCDKPTDAALALSYDAHQRLIGSSDTSGSRTISYSVDSTNGGTSVEVKVTPSAGGTIYNWKLSYDAAGHLTAWTDEQGMAHSYSYDTLGRLTAVTVADQPEASFAFTYNLADLLVKRVDGTGRGVAYNYDAAGRLILQQNVLTKDSVSYTYDTRGQLSSQISPLGSVTTYEYNDPVDPTRLTAVITAAGREQFSWNDANATVTYTDPRGNQTVYTFDGLGELWKVATPAGRVYQLVYDEAGSLTGWQVNEGSNSRSVTLDYDFAKDRVTVGADGVDWNWAFDFTSAGQLAGVTNPAGQKLGLSYDPLGKLTALIAGDKLQWTLQHTDSSDLTVTSPTGDTSYKFDSLYRLVKKQQGEATTGYEYATSGDPNGLVNARLTDADGTQIYTFWPGDERQPPQIIVRTAGQRLTYTYNTEGLLESISREVCLVAPFADLKGAALDQITQLSPTACQDETSTAIWLGSTRYLYDTLGQPIRAIDAEQNSESFTYDAVGNLVSYQNPDGKSYTYEYDGQNRVSRLSSPAGIDLLFSYALDGIAGVCQAPSLDHEDYAGCSAAGGVIQSYSYDALGRRLDETFPLTLTQGNASGQVAWAYDAAGGGAPTDIGGLALTYTADGLGLLKKSGDQEVNTAGLNRFASISGDAALDVTYDPQGRLATVKSQGNSLSISYADDGGGYTIKDDKSGAALIFTVGGNGLIDSIDTKPGNPDDKTPALQIQYIGQEANGLTSFSLLWGDNYVTDFRANRRGENIYLNHQTQDFDLGLTLDTVHSSSGLLQRQVFTGGSKSAGYFSSNVKGGYITVLGYDQNDRLLTMRLSEADGNRLIYQATYVYSDYGQLVQETRQYEGGTQAVIAYRYDTTARNLLIGTDVSISQAKPADQQSALGIVALLLLGSGGALGLRRFGMRRMASGALVAGLLMGMVGFMPNSATVAQDNPTPVTQARFSYTYDAHGNLVSITPEGGKDCVTYTYDVANHLTGVTNADKTSVAYKYDAYGRLVAAGKTSLVYVGASQTPLMVVENSTPRFYAQTADGNTLFQATGNTITPFISSGDGQVLGQRAYGTAEKPEDVHPVWLFDPLGRYLTLTAPAAVTDPCAILVEKPDASIPNFLPAFNGMLWDTQTNLYFGQGRAYAPTLARFLQRDPLGPDAQGNVYDFAARRSTPPVRKADVPYLEGLLKLTSAIDVQSQLARLDAASVASEYAPAPLGAMNDVLASALNQPRQQQQDTLEGMINLPAWLANNYNLPGAHFDTSSGALRVLSDNAPGQGGWGVAAQLDLQKGIWGNALEATTPLAPQQQLAGLVARTQLVPQPLTTYLNQAWQASEPTLASSWQVVVPGFSVAQTPAAVLDKLPRALHNFDQALSVLKLGQSLDGLIYMRGVDWVQRLLSEALPTTPTLPPADTAAWKSQWFEDALSGLQFGGIPLPALPNVKLYALGLGLGAR